MSLITNFAQKFDDLKYDYSLITPNVNAVGQVKELNRSLDFLKFHTILSGVALSLNVVVLISSETYGLPLVGALTAVTVFCIYRNIEPAKNFFNVDRSEIQLAKNRRDFRGDFTNLVTNVKTAIEKDKIVRVKNARCVDVSRLHS